jgi:hypothetical protein
MIKKIKSWIMAWKRKKHMRKELNFLSQCAQRDNSIK